VPSRRQEEVSFDRVAMLPECEIFRVRRTLLASEYAGSPACASAAAAGQLSLKLASNLP